MLHLAQPRRVEVDGDHGDVGALQHVRGLAAGGAAGVEHAHARGQVQQFDGKLCRGVLHRQATFVEPRQHAHVGRLVEDDGVWQADDRTARMTRRRELFKRRVAAQPARVHPQGHGPLPVAGGEYGIGLRAPVPRDVAHHPVRMRVLDDGIVRQGRHQRRVFTLHPPQDCVDQPTHTRQVEQRAGVHRFVERRVVGGVHVEQLVDAAQQQRLQRGSRLRRLGHQRRQQGLQPGAMAQHAVDQRPGERVGIVRQGVVQAAAVEHGHQGFDGDGARPRRGAGVGHRRAW